MIPDFTTAAPVLALTALAAFLLGSVPFGIVMARLFGLGDLRQIGSGNIGATNVLRTGNKLAAFLTLILDAGKGGMAVLIARALIGEDAAQIAAFFAFLGHCYPVFLGFKGGKGVATFLGTLIALFWPAGIAACLVWLITAALTRYSSLSALVAAALSPVLVQILGMPQATLLTVALAALIFARHQANIHRLLSGAEPKIGKKT